MRLIAAYGYLALWCVVNIKYQTSTENSTWYRANLLQDTAKWLCFEPEAVARDPETVWSSGLKLQPLVLTPSFHSLSGVEAGICISDKFPTDADALDLNTRLWSLFSFYRRED